MRTPLVAGNWKMHNTLASARELVAGIVEGIAGQTGVDVLICPPCQLLLPMAKAVADTPVMLGAQNAHEEAEGAFTGEVSAAMLKDAGCTHVIIGHSERRQHFGETGPLLAKKVRAVVSGELSVIYCLGETLDQREAGKTEDVVRTQLTEVITAQIPADRLIVAYEPVWAIGTGKNATPQQAQAVHALLREELASIYDQATAGRVRVLYGGSVKPANAEPLMNQPDIDGALVGGASLVWSDFVAIIAAARSAVMAVR